jgi:ankyrin repeat protein
VRSYALVLRANPAAPRRINSEQLTPLHLAAERGDLAILKVGLYSCCVQLTHSA